MSLFREDYLAELISLRTNLSPFTKDYRGIDLLDATSPIYDLPQGGTQHADSPLQSIAQNFFYRLIFNME